MADGFEGRFPPKRFKAALETADRQETRTASSRSVRLHEKIAGLKRQMQELQGLESTIKTAPDQQISLTDPDARAMATSGKGTGIVVPVLARGKTTIGRLLAYVRDDRPFAGPALPAALFHYSPDRRGEHPQRHLATYAGILQADAYAGFGELYHPARKIGPVTEAGCWAELPKVPRAQHVE